MDKSAVPAPEELPAYLAEAIAPLAQLDDEVLWETARSHFPVEAAERLEALHLQKQADGISPAEAEELAALLREYERAMLVRAEAAAILRRRGHDVSGLAYRGPASSLPTLERP
jgi:hypothetical protein